MLIVQLFSRPCWVSTSSHSHLQLVDNTMTASRASRQYLLFTRVCNSVHQRSYHRIYVQGSATAKFSYSCTSDANTVGKVSRWLYCCKFICKRQDTSHGIHHGIGSSLKYNCHGGGYGSLPHKGKCRLIGQSCHRTYHTGYHSPWLRQENGIFHLIEINTVCPKMFSRGFSSKSDGSKPPTNISETASFFLDDFSDKDLDDILSSENVELLSTEEVLLTPEQHHEVELHQSGQDDDISDIALNELLEDPSDGMPSTLAPKSRKKANMKKDVGTSQKTKHTESKGTVVSSLFENKKMATKLRSDQSKMATSPVVSEDDPLQEMMLSNQATTKEEIEDFLDSNMVRNSSLVPHI